MSIASRISSAARRISSAARRLDVFAVIEKLLTAASLALVAITVGGQLGEMIGLHGKVGAGIGWSIAIVYDALWIGALRMSEIAIRQRSKVGMAVMLGLSAIAVGVSATILLLLGHAEVFAFVPVAAALFMGLRLFAGNVLADSVTAARIAEQSAADRNDRALAAADARHLQSQATTEVYLETAGHLGEMERQIARADVLTRTQKKVNKARSKAETRLAKSETDHGQKAVAFLQRDLALPVTRPVVTPAGHTRGRLQGHAGVTQVTAEIEAVTLPPVTPDETDRVATAGQGPVDNPMTLEELAHIAGVELPQPGVILTNEQISVVIRWLRYDMEPPRSYRQAQAEYRKRGFKGKEKRVRLAWAEIEALETGTPTR